MFLQLEQELARVLPAGPAQGRGALDIVRVAACLGTIGTAIIWLLTFALFAIGTSSAGPYAVLLVLSVGVSTAMTLGCPGRLDRQGSGVGARELGPALGVLLLASATGLAEGRADEAMADSWTVTVVDVRRLCEQSSVPAAVDLTSRRVRQAVGRWAT